MGRYRLGVTDGLTAGGRLEASRGLISFGPSFDLRLKPGFLHFASAGRHAAGLTGGALSVGYTYAAPRFGGGVSLLTQSRNYANISQTPSADRATSAITGFLTAQIGRQSVGVQIFRRGDRDGCASSQIALTASTIVARKFSLAVTVERDTSSTAGPHSSIVAMLTRPLGRLGATLTEKIDPLNGGTNLQVQGSPSRLFGLGYIASVDSAHTINGSFLYRSQYGDAGIDYSKGRGSVFADTLRLSGGLAIIGHGIYLTRPVTGSFALVDIPDTSGIHIYLENQDVGKTNKHGKLLITGLLPNYGNSVRLEDADAPLNTSLQTEQKFVAPPPKGGAVITFPAVRLQALVGVLQVIVNGKPVVPADGELVLSGNGFDGRSDIGTGGEFYLENIPAGKYKALIRFAQGDCAFDLVAPASTEMLLNLGTVTCRKS